MKRASHSPRLQSGMAHINKLNGFLTLYRINPNEKLFTQIADLLSPEKLTKILTDSTSNSKISSADFIRIGQTYELLANFIASGKSASQVLDSVKTCVSSDRSTLEAFYQKMSDEDIRLFGAQIWLALSELFIASAQFKLSSQDWGQIFLPIEKWFGDAGCEAVEVCLEKWSALIAFVSSKSPKEIRRSGKYIQLIQIFSKPLRSRTTINKFSNMLPLIRTYAFLIRTFEDVLDERFEELIICFLRFLAGRKAQVLTTSAEIESELRKSIDSSELILNCTIPSHLGYLTDDRTYNSSDSLTLYILPTVSSVLGVAYNGHPTDIPLQIPSCGNKPDMTQKYAVFFGQMLRLAGRKCSHEDDVAVLGSCFAALSQRISSIEEVAVKMSESRLLFKQVQAWVEENNYGVEILEPVLCDLFTTKNLFMYANTPTEWSARALLNSLLQKNVGDRISHLLEATAGTLVDVFENHVLKRVGELSGLMETHLQQFEVVSLMKAWTQLADITKVFISDSGDINEGGLIRPDFRTTFGLLRLIFRIANVAEEDVDAKVLQKCTASFGELYSEAQTGVRHEHGCSAETILKGLYDDLILPETFCCINVYTSAFASLVEVYPFNFINEDEVFSAASSEFSALGEITPLIKAVTIVGGKLIEMISTVEKDSKLSKSILEDVSHIINVVMKLFQNIKKPSIIRNMFLSMSGLFKDMYSLIFTEDVRFKMIAGPALEAYLTVLKLVKTKASGPYDESMLNECAPFFIQLLGGMHGKRAKLRAAAADLWNNTFAKAVFNYPIELRKILINLVQKRIVFAAGLPRKSINSSDINEYGEVTESHSNSSSQCSQGTINSCAAVNEDPIHKRRSKRFAAPANVTAEEVSMKKAREDPDGITIVKKETELPSSPSVNEILKKEEIRDSPQPSPSLQTSATKRRKFIGLLEEDSVDYVPIGTSDSAKKMKLTERQKEVFSAKRDRMPFLDEESQSAVIANLGKEFDLESSQSASANGGLPLSTEPAHSDLPNEVQADGGLTVTHEELNGEKTDLVKLDLSPENTNQQQRRSSKKLIFDTVVDSTTNPAPDSNLESSEDSTDSSELSTEFSTDSHPTPSDVTKPPRSRRSQKKGTPMKYVAKNRRRSLKSTTKNHATSKLCTREADDAITEDATASREQNSKISDTDSASESLDDLTPLREIQDVLVSQASADESFDEQLPGDATDSVVTTSKNVETNENTSATTNAMNPSVLQRVAGTPGILKKIDSPSTAEKKFRRVHFGNSFEEPALNNGTSEKTPSIEGPFPASPKGVLKSPGARRPFANVQPTEEKVLLSNPSQNISGSPRNNDDANSEDQIFPDLSECQEPIAKIVSRLSLTSTNTGSITLRKTLEARGILEIRHLACLSRREVAGLNIKKPRVETAVKALAQFARDHSPQKQRVVIPEPGSEPATIATDDAMLPNDSAKETISADAGMIPKEKTGEEEHFDERPLYAETQPSDGNSTTCESDETERNGMIEVDVSDVCVIREKEQDDDNPNNSRIEEECASLIEMVTATVSSEVSEVSNRKDDPFRAQLEARARIAEALEEYQELATKFQHITNKMLRLYEAAEMDAADLKVMWTDKEINRVLIYRIMNMINLIDLGQLICHFISGFFPIFPGIIHNSRFFSSFVGSTVNSLWQAMFPYFCVLSISRILIIKKRIDPNQLTWPLWFILAVGWLFILTVWLWSWLGMAFVFGKIGWEYDFTMWSSRYLQILELAWCWPAILICYLMYVGIIIHLVVSKKQGEAASKSHKQEILIFLQATFLNGWMFGLMATWHNSVRLGLTKNYQQCIINCVWILFSYLNPILLIVLNKKKIMMKIVVLVALIAVASSVWDGKIQDIPGISIANMERLRQMFNPLPKDKNEVTDKMSKWMGGLTETEKTSFEAFLEEMRKKYPQGMPVITP
ncbi:unnamed protein product [Cylicocyclus nassatus]|uniref:Telomere-associated protein Rif1 N-terminal domain-containing protein n=1 Tax=Cylicocyclus nassatus TaxID=53992 RepID=A0AA36H402_CYLNA|nr:unnamed protein product [Cylicocyclus nassatus]